MQNKFHTILPELSNQRLLEPTFPVIKMGNKDLIIMDTDEFCTVKKIKRVGKL